MEQNKQYLIDLRGTVKHINIHIMGVSESEKVRRRDKEYSKN